MTDHITIPRALLEQARWNFEATDTDVLVCRNYHDKGQKCEFERLHPAEVLQLLNEYQSLILRLESLKTAPQPAWHDAPTEPGFWVRSGDGCVGVYSIREEAIKILKGSAARWYGPIPEDKQ